jgi:OFA family oxalate/formate antiporter-like MFS transporter
MKKMIILISSIIIMVCLGGVYAWSIFVMPLMDDHGLSTAQTQFIFGVTIAAFTLAMIFAGRMEKKRGPRLTAIIGAILFGAGYLLASFSGGKFGYLLTGIGILSGAGIAFGYVCSLATPIKWFPHRKGLITGLSVAGFGGGAILLSFIVKLFLESSMPVMEIFRFIGIVYGVVLFLSALVFTVPEATDRENAGTTPKITELARDRKLWALFLGMFAGTFAGLLVVGNLKPIGLSYGLDKRAATLAISFLAIGNMTGRIFWGYLSDRLEVNKTIVGALLFLSLSTFLLLFGAGYPLFFMLLSFTTGLGFGANFVLFAAEVSHVYGIDKLGTVYPFVFLSYGFAGIFGPATGGWLFDVMKTYNTPIILSAVLCACGAAVFTMLMSKNKKIVNT